MADRVNRGIVHNRKLKFSFRTSEGREECKVNLYASADVTCDASSVYVKVNVIGMICDNLLRRKNDFLGPFPDRIILRIKPLQGASGVREDSSWPGTECLEVTHDKSTKLKIGLDEVNVSAAGVASIKGLLCWEKTTGFHTKSIKDVYTFAPEPDSESGIYVGSTNVWGGPPRIENYTIPDEVVRYRKWRSLPYKPGGFGNHKIEHTFKWDRVPNEPRARFEVQMGGRLGHLYKDGGSWSFKKPYKFVYTCFEEQKANIVECPLGVA